MGIFAKMSVYCIVKLQGLVYHGWFELAFESLGNSSRKLLIKDI